ncbi:hypothetical protein [Methylophaga sp. OBS3]|uniref:hypothetical protein n=1 Tax=Methylophaga sp. OBS3 TaxID=2991934 RepID=UPI00225504C5|nr:hypothetical protein [Methylophaga sp. OBS3]
MYHLKCISSFIFAGLLIGLAQPVWSDEQSAADLIVFTQESDEDCEEKGGKRIFINNRHQQHIVDLHLDRYFANVRQGGRSMFALAPQASQALGCSKAFDSEQNWQLVNARFINEEAAIQRYGEIIGLDKNN